MWKCSCFICTLVVGCGVLTAPDHGAMSQTGLKEGSTANYSCEEGYTLSVKETRVCLDKGVWSGNQPTCNGRQCTVLSLKHDHSSDCNGCLMYNKHNLYTCMYCYTSTVVPLWGFIKIAIYLLHLVTT